MTPEEADLLTERVVGHFQMCGRYLNEEAQLAYGELFQPFNFAVASRVVTEAIRTSNEPWSVARYATRLREETPRREVERTPPTTGIPVEERRANFRSGVKTALLDEEGKPKNAFAAHVLRQWEREERSA